MYVPTSILHLYRLRLLRLLRRHVNVLQYFVRNPYPFAAPATAHHIDPCLKILQCDDEVARTSARVRIPLWLLFVRLGM